MVARYSPLRLGSYITLLFTLLLIAEAHAINAVHWKTEYHPSEKQLTISIETDYALQDVRAEIRLVNGTGEMVGSKTFNLTNNATAILEKGKKHVRVFPLSLGKLTISDRSLLFARPILSSPKATAPGLMNMLKSGIHARLHRTTQ